MKRLTDRGRRVRPLFTEARRAQNELVVSFTKVDLIVIAEFLERFTDLYAQARTDLKAQKHAKLPASPHPQVHWDPPEALYLLAWKAGAQIDYSLGRRLERGPVDRGVAVGLY
jgi:hypothetical protein